MAHYTPEFLAALQHGYEKTDQPMIALANDFGIGISTLSALVEKEGWAKRSQRQRGSPVAPRLADATAVFATLPPRATAAESGPAAEAEGPHAPSPPQAATADERSAVARLEALLVQEIAAEEAARADLGTLPRLRAEADGCMRRLAILTQTLKVLRDIPAAPPPTGPFDDDDMPDDLDAFREELARRIDAFVASRPDEADAACNGLDDTADVAAAR